MVSHERIYQLVYQDKEKGGVCISTLEFVPSPTVSVTVAMIVEEKYRVV
jgi:hypothetical protein